MNVISVDFSQAVDSLRAMVNEFLEQLPQICVAFIVFLVFFFASALVRNAIVGFSSRYRKHHNFGLVVGRLARGFIILLGLLVALVIAIPGFKAGQLFGVLGISSVAIGFAFRDILQNFLAGILLLLSEPFRINDQIKVGNFEGTVEDIQTRATFIRTYDGQRVVIPNSKLFNESVVVATAFESRRLQYDIGIGYGDDIERARKIMLDAARELDEVLNDPPPEAFVVELAASTVNIRLRWWIKPPRRHDEFEVRDRVLSHVKRKLSEAGVDLPFDTQVVLFHDQTEEWDGDRTQQREGWPAPHEGEAPRPARVVMEERKQNYMDERTEHLHQRHEERRAKQESDGARDDQ